MPWHHEVTLAALYLQQMSRKDSRAKCQLIFVGYHKCFTRSFTAASNRLLMHTQAGDGSCLLRRKAASYKASFSRIVGKGKQAAGSRLSVASGDCS